MTKCLFKFGNSLLRLSRIEDRYDSESDRENEYYVRDCALPAVFGDYDNLIGKEEIELSIKVKHILEM